MFAVTNRSGCGNSIHNLFQELCCLFKHAVHLSLSQHGNVNLVLKTEFSLRVVVTENIECIDGNVSFQMSRSLYDESYWYL
jgi:hypothetical protein